MKSGKSLRALTSAYQAREAGQDPILIVPAIDTRNKATVSTRFAGGVSVEADITLAANENVADQIAKQIKKVGQETGRTVLPRLFVDEVQFLTPEQVEQLHRFAHENGIDTETYGIYSDFRLEGFPGSDRVQTLAREIITLTQDCMDVTCIGHKTAECNTRLLDGEVTYEGPQILLDREKDEQGRLCTYTVLCAHCYYKGGQPQLNGRPSEDKSVISE